MCAVRLSCFVRDECSNQKFQTKITLTTSFGIAIASPAMKNNATFFPKTVTLVFCIHW
jgi:hypothetical protein